MIPWDPGVSGASRGDPVLPFQYHINKLSIMSSENHLNHSDKDVDEVDAALSDLEITLEGGKTSTILVRAAGNFFPRFFPFFFFSNCDEKVAHTPVIFSLKYRDFRYQGIVLERGNPGQLLEKSWRSQDLTDSPPAPRHPPDEIMEN